MEQFKTNILAIYGEVGESWLASLPKLLAQIAGQWNLIDLERLTYCKYDKEP